MYRILQHFNTSSDEYCVIFVSNCTAGLKLVAESFHFIELCPQLCSCVRSDCSDDADLVTDPSAPADCFYEKKAESDYKEFRMKHQDDEEVLDHKLVDEHHDVCDDSRRVSETKFDTCVNSADCIAAAAGTGDEDDRDCDTYAHSELSARCCEWDSELMLKPTFLCLDDNHTSVIGMRRVTARHGAQFCCIQPDKVDAFLSSLQQPDIKPSVTTCSLLLQEKPCYIINSLFAYPAQSNFSGHRYPLEWMDAIHCRSELEQSSASGTCPQCECRTRPHWYVLLDAAALLTTSTLDLSRHKPDFVVLSFYKMFGFPTGLGTLYVCCCYVDVYSAKVSELTCYLM